VRRFLRTRDVQVSNVRARDPAKKVRQSSLPHTRILDSVLAENLPLQMNGFVCTVITPINMCIVNLFGFVLGRREQMVEEVLASFTSSRCGGAGTCRCMPTRCGSR
jgi:hypothetical protein